MLPPPLHPPAPQSPHTHTTPWFNAEPPNPDQPPQTLAPRPCTSARPPPQRSPHLFFCSPSPLLSRQAARMAGMETFTDGSTGKFSTFTKTHTHTDTYIYVKRDGGGGVLGGGGEGVASCTLYSTDLFTFPLSCAVHSPPFSSAPSQITNISSQCQSHQKKKGASDYSPLAREPDIPHGSGPAGRGLEISVLMIFVCVCACGCVCWDGRVLPFLLIR